jgi:hypothetical protein
MTSNAKTSRPPPAYQEYASDMLANARYRTMSLAERGLMDTIRRECWLNGSVPKDPQTLAEYLGKEGVIANLSNGVLSFFREWHDQLICPELDTYKTALADQKQRMSDGGRRGGRSTQQQHKVAKATLEGTLKPLSRDEVSGVEVNKVVKRSLGTGITSEEMDQWNADYDNAPDAADAYLQASKGGH